MAETEADVAFVPLVTVRGGEEEGKRITHDEVIRQTGARRRSGVRWYLTYGQTEARAKLDSLYESYGKDGLNEPHALTEMTLQAGLDQYRAFIAEHGENVVLIVAAVDAEAP